VRREKAPSVSSPSPACGRGQGEGISPRPKPSPSRAARGSLPLPQAGEGQQPRGGRQELIIVIHSLDEARAALGAARAAGCRVTLASAPAAGGYAGPGWFKAVCDLAAEEAGHADFAAILDCGEEAGTVLAALRAGLRRVRFTGAAAAAERLADIAAQYGAVIELGAAPPALDLADAADPEAACRAFFARNGAAS